MQAPPWRAPNPSRRRVGGFTIIELLLVVAIVGILATIGVIVYRRMTAKAKKSEVFAMIAAIKQGQEAYKAENSRYLSSGSSETDYYPVLGSAGTEPALKKWEPSGSNGWVGIPLSVPKNALYCGYVVIAGDAGSFSGAGVRGRTLFQNVAPNRAWYYIRAECDFDSQPATNSTFETTFETETVFIDNEGT